MTNFVSEHERQLLANIQWMFSQLAEAQVWAAAYAETTRREDADWAVQAYRDSKNADFHQPN